MVSRTTLIAFLACTLQACAQTPATQPYAGVIYSHEIREKPPQHIHVVTIDLEKSSLHFVVARGSEDPDGPGPWQTALQTVRTTAEIANLDVAVNGDFFSGKTVMNVGGLKVPYFVGNWARVSGEAMSDGAMWSDGLAPASLMIDDKGNPSIAQLKGRPPANARQIVSGKAILVEHGRNTAPVDLPAPRTAVGIDSAHRRVFLHVVDGRRPGYATGMTLREQADELILLGCDVAIQLDGGGSSTLMIRNPQSRLAEVLNRPSDGHQLLLPMSIERPVANVLGVRIDKPVTPPATQPATQPARRP